MSAITHSYQKEPIRIVVEHKKYNYFEDPTVPLKDKVEVSNYRSRMCFLLSSLAFGATGGFLVAYPSIDKATSPECQVCQDDPGTTFYGLGGSALTVAVLCCYCWAKYRFCPQQTDCFETLCNKL